MLITFVNIKVKNISLLRIRSSPPNKGGGGATLPLSRDGGVEELHGYPKVGPRPKVWNRGRK